MFSKDFLKKIKKKILIKNLINIMNYVPFIILYYNFKNKKFSNFQKVLYNVNIFTLKIKNIIFTNIFNKYYKINLVNNLIKNNINFLFSLYTYNLLIFIKYLDKNYINIYYIIYKNFFLNPSRTLLLEKNLNNNKIKCNIIQILKQKNTNLIKLLKYNNFKLIFVLKIII